MSTMVVIVKSSPAPGLPGQSAWKTGRLGAIELAGGGRGEVRPLSRKLEGSGDRHFLAVRPAAHPLKECPRQISKAREYAPDDY